MRTLRNVAAAILGTAMLSASPPAGLPTDAWSGVTILRTPGYRYATPLHATLMPDGTVEMIGYDKEQPGLSVDFGGADFKVTPTPLGQPHPAEINVQKQVVPYLYNHTEFIFGYIRYDDVICAGQTLLADGTLFAAGGTSLAAHPLFGSTAGGGLESAFLFDGSTDTWSRIPALMKGTPFAGYPSLRWYPTATATSTGEVLVTGGFAFYHPVTVANRTVESYRPSDQTWHLLSDINETPSEIETGNYTHVYQLVTQLADGWFLMFGAAGVPVLFTPFGSPAWTVRHGSPRPGTLPGELPNAIASSAMLPIRLQGGEWGYSNGSVLMAGGSGGTTHGHSADVYDPTADSWSPRIELGIERQHPVVLVMPDGKLLLINGCTEEEEADDHVVRYIDPRNGFAVEAGTAEEPTERCYHGTATLLPDGRVLVAGGLEEPGQNVGTEQPNLSYYSPPYMAQPRPTLNQAPATVAYGQNFPIDYDLPGGVLDEAVLIRLGSMTHCFDMNQRYVQVKVLDSDGMRATLLAPSDPKVAPPGHYMLFILDEQRVPSIAKIIRIS